MAKNYSITTEKTLMDINTGEVVKAETTKTVVKKIDCDHFYMLFNGFAEKAKGLSGSSREIFDYLCEHAIWDTGETFITKTIRLKLQKELNISQSACSRALKALFDKGLLVQKEYGTFISPDIFWKGNQKTRRKLLLENAELEITYTIKNKNLVEVEEESQE